MLSYNIYLLGFMGAGKTTIGKSLSTRLGFKFIDLDKYIVEQQGCSINQIFSEHGESVFRAYESRALEVLSSQRDCVFSTGGGIIGCDHNWQVMKANGITIFLNCDWITLERRLAESDERPLVKKNNFETLKTLYQHRLLTYQQADYCLDVDRLTVDEVVEKIVRLVAKELS